MAQIRKWIENQTRRIRSLAKPQASRATRPSKKDAGNRAHRYLSIALVAVISAATLSSFFLPKSSFSQLKEKLLRQPDDFELQLQLAQDFLESHQFEEAEKALLLAQGITIPSNTVLGQQTSQKLEELWQKKQDEDPVDIQKLIIAWGKIMNEKPGYRDGWLQLAALNYKIYQNDKAREYLNKALEIDPNYEPAKEFKESL